MDKPELIYETYVRASAEKVFQALTDPEFTSKYFHNTHVTSDWKPGSPVRFDNEDGSTAVDGEVLVYDPPHLLSITWHPLYDPDTVSEKPSRVTFSITAMGDVCKLRTVHDRFEHADGVYKNVELGWFFVLDNLKTYLETGKALELTEA